ncbi:MAG: pyruvate synthase subunit PorD [Proteobacteria bacterium]|nr:pyruvate synthase subunit PorD [Pseudomonadota bacterium]
MKNVESEPGWRQLETGFVISEPGTSRQYKTGDWRSLRPVVDEVRCVKCGVCYIFCPDMAVVKTAGGTFEADLFYCKGCGICAQECFIGCITMMAEEE